MKSRSFTSNSKSPLRFVTRVALLAATVYVVQAGLFHTVGPWGYRVPHSEILPRIQGTSQEVLYFGDSVTVAVGSRDQDKRMLPEMLAERVPDREIISLRHFAYHPGIYREYSKYFLRNGKLPENIVIPLNLSSFSPLWVLGPNYQFVKELAILENEHKPWISPFIHALFAFRYFDLRPISAEKYEAAPLRNGRQVVGRVGDLKHVRPDNATEADIKKYFLGWYMGEIETTSPRISDLRDLARLLSEAKRKTFIYFTPLDYQTGERFYGPEFSAQVKANVATVQTVLAEFNMTALDLTRELPSSRFIWPYDEKLPSDHIDDVGRQFVASNVASLLNADMKKMRLVP